MQQKPLLPQEAAAKESKNPSSENPRASTIKEKDTKLVPVKYNFDINLGIPPFFGKSKVMEY